MEEIKQIRKIIHVDMDAFYASVEQLDNPELRGKPIAVGGGERGVVSAASYEARKYGVKSAMASKIAAKNCPHLIFVKPRFHRYKEISSKIREIFSRYTDLIEPLSLDEAYLDVTDNKMNEFFATQIAIDIRKNIEEELGLTASAGVSFNKFLAKIASDENKPNGITVITPEKAPEFVDQLPIQRFFGIGKVTAAKMMSNGIFTGKDLKSKRLDELIKFYGKSGNYYYQMVRLNDHRRVNPNRIRKSIGVEHTYYEDIRESKKIYKKLDELAEELAKRMNRSNAKGRTLTVKIKYNDFTQQTKSMTFDHYISKKLNLMDGWKIILDESFRVKKPIRLLGLSVSNLKRNEVVKTEQGKQLKFKF
ncbi:MAG: DNA polymerase IV [Flavobacteriales bacterium]